MDISAGLIAKGAAGALAASAATAAGVIYKDQIFGKSRESTKFDQGLIDFLSDKGDIVFEVKKNENDDLAADTALTFDSGKKTLSLTAKVSVNTGNAEKLIEKSNPKDGDKGTRAALKKLNGNGGEDVGTDWTWICEIKFEATGVNSAEGKSIYEKDKIFKSDTEGLFALLKKKISEESEEKEKQKLRGIKKKFIKNCASERTNNEEIKNSPTLAGNKLESTIPINLKVGKANDKNGQTDPNTLYPKTKKPFGKFFDEIKEEITATLPS